MQRMTSAYLPSPVTLALGYTRAASIWNTDSIVRESQRCEGLFLFRRRVGESAERPDHLHPRLGYVTAAERVPLSRVLGFQPLHRCLHNQDVESCAAVRLAGELLNHFGADRQQLVPYRVPQLDTWIL